MDWFRWEILQEHPRFHKEKTRFPAQIFRTKLVAEKTVGEPSEMVNFDDEISSSIPPMNALLLYSVEWDGGKTIWSKSMEQ